MHGHERMVLSPRDAGVVASHLVRGSARDVARRASRALPCWHGVVMITVVFLVGCGADDDARSHVVVSSGQQVDTDTSPQLWVVGQSDERYAYDPDRGVFDDNDGSCGPPALPPSPPRGRSNGDGDLCACTQYVRDNETVERVRAALPPRVAALLVCRSRSQLSWRLWSRKSAPSEQDLNRAPVARHEVMLRVLNVGPQTRGCRPVGVHASAVPPHTVTFLPRDAERRVTALPVANDWIENGFTIAPTGPFSPPPHEAHVVFSLEQDGNAGESFGDVQLYNSENDMDTVAVLPMEFRGAFVRNVP